MATAPNPDKAALAMIGTLVRERLDADPSAYKVPLEDAELYAVSDFLTPEECDRLIALVDAMARPSEVFEEVYQPGYRTSYSGDMDSSDTFVRMIERRFSDLLGVDPGWGETIQGQRYATGQEYKEHCDWFDTGSHYWNQENVRGGQRSWTAMAYLNDVEAGGVTNFPHLDVSIPPQRGALLIWNNANVDGSPNGKTLHAALPVESGSKYVITKWFRTRPWH